MNDSMLEALHRKKAGGLDITILLGGEPIMDQMNEDPKMVEAVSGGEGDTEKPEDLGLAPDFKDEKEEGEESGLMQGGRGALVAKKIMDAMRK